MMNYNATNESVINSTINSAIAREEFNEKFLSHQDSLFKVAFYILESEDDALDALQELYLKLWQKRSTLGAVINPKAYCITLLKNQCIDKLRRKSKIQSNSLGGSSVGGKSNEDKLSSVISYDKTQDDVLDTKQRLDMVKAAMKALSPSEATVLRMKIFDDMNYDQISEKTGIASNSLRVHFSNARRKIKEIISKRVNPINI